MLTTARPIFEHVPASFADPVGLADQQAEGVVSLIVVRYGCAEGEDHDALGPFFDAYVAVSGQLLAVARTTADYRYPVTPSVALARFIEHRDAGRPAYLSLYELSEDECARFVETVFYSECLKLHVDGAASAPFVAHQIVRSGCGNGILEINDFSDPQAPRIRLMDLGELAASIGTVSRSPMAGGEGTDPDVEPGVVEPTGLAAVLAGHLDGVEGRVLLFDREKNRLAMPHRAGRPFDLDAAIQEANRLAEARRATGGGAWGHPETLARSAAAELRGAIAGPGAAPDDQIENVEAYLAERARKPRRVAAQHPHATGLAALVAELQGHGTASGVGGLAATLEAHAPEIGSPSAQPLPSSPTEGGALNPGGGVSRAPGGASEPHGGVSSRGGIHFDAEEASADRGGSSDGAASGDGQAGAPPRIEADPGDAASVETSAERAAPRTPATMPVSSGVSSGRGRGSSPRAGARHVLATELDVLRADVYALFEDAVGRDRAVPHEAHILDVTGIPTPVPAERTIDYLRALLTEPPPKRWHFFKRQRGKTYETVCGKLLAFHAANGHVDSPVIHEVNKLWARLCQ